MRQKTQMVEVNVRNRWTKVETTAWLDLKRKEVRYSDIHGMKTCENEIFLVDWEILGTVQKDNKE